MEWPTIRAAMAGVITTITGIQPAHVVWKGSLEAASINVATKAVLSTHSLGSISDETRRVLPELTDALVVTRSGMRRFTWNITIETQNQTTGTARVLMDRVRALLNAPSILPQLLAVDVAVADYLSTNYNDYLGSGREISWASMDVLMNAADNVSDDLVGSGNWIGDAIITSGEIKQGDETLATITDDIDAREETA